MCIRDRLEAVLAAVRRPEGALDEVRHATDDPLGRAVPEAVSYTHLTLPTSEIVQLSVVAGPLKNKQ